jgi:hypothetical protein
MRRFSARSYALRRVHLAHIKPSCGARDFAKLAGLDTAAFEAPNIAMANKAQFSILAYQRRPGFWRAAISRKDGAVLTMNGVALKSVVTSEDFPSEEEAYTDAEKVIRMI